jgi:hypothetical protein
MSVDSKTVQNYYGQGYLSADAILEPQYYAKYLRRYGLGIGFMEWMRLAGADKLQLKGRTLNLIEGGSLKRPIKLGTAIATTLVKATQTFKLDATCYDSSGNCALKAYDSIVIPRKYLTISGVASITDKIFRVNLRSGSASDYTFTIQCPDQTVAIAVEVPIGTDLMIGPTSFAPGTGQPLGVTTADYTRSFTTGILKKSVIFEGGASSHQTRESLLIDGSPTIFDRGLLETDILMNADFDESILLGEQNSTGITMTNAQGDSATVLGSLGILPHMVDKAQKYPYNITMDITDFDSLRESFESQGVTDTNINVYTGNRINTKLENSGLKFVSEVSGGTDLYKTIGELGFVFNRLFKNGMTYNFFPLKSTGDPSTWNANSDYSFGDLMLLIPNGESKVKNMVGVDNAPPKIKNLEMAYLNWGGEDRKRIVRRVDGMTGRESVAVDQYDRESVYLLSEYALVFTLVNQSVLAYLK